MFFCDDSIVSFLTSSAFSVNTTQLSISIASTSSSLSVMTLSTFGFTIALSPALQQLLLDSHASSFTVSSDMLASSLTAIPIALTVFTSEVASCYPFASVIMPDDSTTTRADVTVARVDVGGISGNLQATISFEHVIEPYACLRCLHGLLPSPVCAAAVAFFLLLLGSSRHAICFRCHSVSL